VTGYWFLDRSPDWNPPPELAAFLAAGPPPVCIGFGSMIYDREELVRLVERAWGGLRPPTMPANMVTVDWAPLNWLFSRMSAVVHHGGAGTTAEGLRAGAPTVVVPFFYDQFLWARRVFELGAGPRPIPRKRLDAESLAQAIPLATSDPEMRPRAAAVGAKIRAEDGVARAVAAFERHMRRSGGTAAAPSAEAAGTVAHSPTPF
jgi:sterol 3beta-glucosyltransferase